MIPDPTSMEFQDWVNAMLVDHPDLPAFVQDWQQWVFTVIQSDALSGMNVVDPRGYNSWVNWALSFIALN